MIDEYLLEESSGEKTWKRILRASMALPGAKVDRSSFLATQLWNYCDEQQVSWAIQCRPALAGISPDLIDKLADSCIKSHVLKASSISFVAGLPGGLTMAGAMPADMAQFYWHALVLAQKLAYLYGWPDLLEDGEVDEQTEIQLTLLIAAMMGASMANQGLTELAKRMAEQAAHRIPKHAFGRAWWFSTLKHLGKWIGISVTKRGFAGGVAKVLPVIGGFLSSGLTAIMMRSMAKRLKNHLRTLRFALPNECEKPSPPNLAVGNQET